MPKRRQQSNSEVEGPSHVRTKKPKFTIENVDLPEITVKGDVLVTGSGDVGQLGLGSSVMEKIRPARVSLNEKIVDVRAGGMHSVCLTSEGKVITFGCNDEGALGRVTKDEEEFDPGYVDLPGKVIQISAGDSHTAALLKDGRVFAWGTFRDNHGNMGMTIAGKEQLPYEIIKNVNIKKIASGADHLVFLSEFGTVYTCGCAEQGQLGRTSERTSNRNARQGFGKDHIESLLKPDIIHLKPSLKLHFDNIWTTTYGTYCKVAGSNDMYVFGLNNYYQLGLKHIGPIFKPTLSKEFSKYKWLMITGGQHHVVGLTTDNQVYVIGRKEYGRLGLGKDLKDDVSELKLVPALKDKTVVNVSCGLTTSFALTQDDKIYAWGMGTGGQLGTGVEDDCDEPTLIEFKKSVQVFKVSGGGQHTIMMAKILENNKNNNNPD